MRKLGKILLQVLRILGIVFDKAVEFLVIRLLLWARISVKPTESRWGVSAFIFGLGFFVFALGAEYSDSGGAVMAATLYTIGAVLMFIGLCLSIYFIRHRDDDSHPSRLEVKVDSVESKVSGIKAKVDKIESDFALMNNKLDQIIDLLTQISNKLGSVEK